ncbi:MAG: glycosyltransferase, partial [Ignavibacteria bacterium]|nr:glycosyltransferase [Ignavibacteria bacterium]
LDVGTGIGDYLIYTNSNQRVVAIEPHAPYIEKARERAPWVEFNNMDALEFFKKNEEVFECILMIDVIEHLNEENAIQLVKEAKKHCSNIIFAQIPIGLHEQNEDVWKLNGDEWQTHRSTWDSHNISKLGFDFIQIWNDWYKWEHNDNRTSIAFWTIQQFPLVSIIVPSYNQAEWLPFTLDSIIAQTYPLWEAVVVDDGSTDNTWEIIEKYSKKDNRIKGIHKENGGISSALNAGINAAIGKYFCWLSSDDLFYPNKLELQINVFQNLDESYGIVFGEFDLIDDKNNLTHLKQKKPFIDGLEFPQQLKYDMIDGCTVMIPMDIMREMNGFNTQFKHAQDTEFWFRLAAKGYKFFYLDKKLVKRRIHEAQGFTDFQLDCRYDGYAIVHFYLSRYSFRDFYKDVNWSNNESLKDFMAHFFDMILDEGCHINHNVINDKFWNWFVNGLLTLDKSTRAKIIYQGIDIFKKKQGEGKLFRKYLERFESAAKSTLKKNPINFSTNYKFEDITKFDRSSETTYSSVLYDFGLKAQKNNELKLAISVYKYLSDYSNPFTANSFKKFYELCFTYEEYHKFIKSFRRKNKITHFNDDTKLLYLWAILSIKSKDDVTEIIESISDKSKKERALSWFSGIFEITKVKDIHFWNYQVIPYKSEHIVKIKCSKCNSIILRKISFDLQKDKSAQKYLCTNCFTGFIFSEGNFEDYFKGKFVSDKEDRRFVNNPPKVVFVMRYTNIIGGGVKVAYKHMQWLHELGCNIITYSDAPKADWIKIPWKFIQVRDHYDIKELHADAVIVFSIYDVPKILTKVSSKKVYHLCQGYEGYHIGKDYEELRSDKYFYTTLHSFEVGNILVSNHLIKMFKEKFGRTGYYIPNSIDFNSFYPDAKIKKEPNSILFIGDPNYPLKGLKFLIESLLKLQNSPERLNNLKLYIVSGGTKQNYEKETKEIGGIQLHYLRGLSKNEVAELLNKVSLYVNCSWYEGFTLPALEAMACGTPVITTNNMGIESFCVGGVNSFIVEYGDINSLIKRILDILLYRVDVNSLIRNGFETALEYSDYNSAVKFLNEYSNILNYKFDKNKVERFLEKFSSDITSLKTNLENKIKKLTEDPIVSIIIVTYNQIQYTLKCIESIRDFVNMSYEIIVIDNSSTDNTLYELERQKDLILIKNETNLGFPTAVNQGITKATGKYILILNNDTILTENLVERMIEVAESDEKIGLVGPLSNEVSGLQKDENAIYSTIDEMFGYAARNRLVNKGQVLNFPRLAFLCTLIKREVIEKIGGLDERFSPGNYEDDDYCLRAQLAGYKAVIAKDVFIHHFGSKSFKADGNDAYRKRLEINREIFVDKWGGTPEEIWLQNKSVNSRQYYYSINKNLFLKYLERTKVHIADNEIDLAEKSVYEAVKTFDDNNSVITYIDLLNLGGNISLANNNLDAAAEYFETELTENSNSSSACLGLGQVLFIREQFEQAKVMFEWAIRYDNNNQHAVKFLAEVNEKLGHSIDHMSVVE